MHAPLPQPPDPDRSVAERIAEVLTRRIVLGELPPGSKVGQDLVAAEFRASHVPVREAFRRLEARGLLVSEPRRGVRVAPIAPEAVHEVTAMRAALEGLALREAAHALTDAVLQEARQALAAAEEGGEILVWEEANRRFHRALVTPCRMPRLLQAIDDLHQASARYLLATWKSLDWEPRSDAEHRAILDSLARGDVEAAVAALREHILAAGRALRERLEGLGRT